MHMCVALLDDPECLPRVSNLTPSCGPDVWQANAMASEDRDARYGPPLAGREEARVDQADLLAAVDAARWSLHRLVGLTAFGDVHRQLVDVLRRAKRREDVTAELMALLDRHDELRRFVRAETRYLAEARIQHEWLLHEARRTGQMQQQDGQQPQQRQATPGEGPYEAARLVNTLVAAAGTDTPIPTGRPLTVSGEYDLLLNIGRYAKGSLLAHKDAIWPEDMLPYAGRWLRAVLSLDGERAPAVRAFYLPPDGDSFACDCHFGGEHLAGCRPRRWARFPLPVPAEPATLGVELVIYHEVAAVHVQILTLPVAVVGAEGSGPRARSTMRLTRTFGDLAKLSGRTASVVISPNASRIVVNGLGFADSPFAISANAADTSALNARQMLYRSHFEVRNGREYSRYDDNFSKAMPAFEADLRALAKEGSALYLRLFASRGEDVAVARTLPALLRQEARLRGRPPVLEVVDARGDEHSMLWALAYDLPLGGDPARYRMCRSVAQFGPGGDGESVPAYCPYEDEHPKGNVVCPFGFWGLSCLIEQPPDTGRNLESVVTSDGNELSVRLAADSSLDRGIAARHVAQLRQRLTEPVFGQLPVTTEDELATALGPATVDVLYLYCHSGYEQRGAGAADRYLTFGDYYVEAQNVNLWAMTVWPDPHWPQRHPLVVLNGCHTTESTSGTLNNFVTAFTRWAGASGVLGTEITLEQGLAGWASEEFLTAMASGATVGDALRRARWTMFRRGNVMGFAYTPYCLANLALRQPDAKEN
jgi:hypothetical protein